MHPLAELIAYLRSLAADLRRRRDYGNLLEVETLQDIGTDLTTERRACADLAYKAEIADQEGLRLLDRIAADGRLDPSEMPDFRRALRHIRHSCAADGRLATQLAQPPA